MWVNQLLPEEFTPPAVDLSSGWSGRKGTDGKYTRIGGSSCREFKRVPRGSMKRVDHATVGGDWRGNRE